MGLYEEFTSKETSNLNLTKSLMKKLCCFDNKQSVKKSSDDDLESYINFITKIVFNCLLLMIFVVCAFLFFFSYRNSTEGLEISTFSSLKYSDDIYSKIFTDNERINPLNYFQKEFENFYLYFSNYDSNSLNLDSLFILLTSTSLFLLLLNFICSNKNREVINFFNIIYIVFVDLFFCSIFYYFNSKNEALICFLRFIYFFILNTIIFIVFNLDTTVKEIFWLFIYKISLLLIFVFTCNACNSSNLFLFEIGLFILVFLFMSIYVSIRMDFRVRSTEFYLIQKNQNEYYQKLINLINKSFLSLNVTFFKITYNESFIKLLKLIGLDDYDINENINYSRNSEQNSKSKSGFKNSTKNNNIYQTNTGTNIPSNNYDEMDNEGKLNRINTRAYLFKNNLTNSNINLNQKYSHLENSQSNNIPNISFDEKINTDNLNLNKERMKRNSVLINNGKDIESLAENLDQNKLQKNNLFKLSLNEKNLENLNINANLFGSPNNIHTTADHLISKNDASQKNLFNTNISKIIKQQEYSGNSNYLFDKKSQNNNYNGSFISKGDNLFNNLSNSNKKNIESINKDFNLTNNANNLNSHNNNTNGYKKKNSRANPKEKLPNSQKPLKFKKTKIQKRLERKMRRRRNRNLVNEEDIFLQKLDFLLEEVFSCFIKEENEQNSKKDYTLNNNSNKEKILLSDIIREIFYSKNNITINSEYQGKGVYVTLPIIKNKIIIELFYRRVQCYEGEIIEFYFNNISEMRERETEKIKGIFRDIVFPNIMHEVNMGFNLIGFILKNVLSVRSRNLQSNTELNLDHIRFENNKKISFNHTKFINFKNINDNFLLEDNVNNPEKILGIRKANEKNTKSNINNYDFPKEGEKISRVINNSLKINKNKESSNSDKELYLLKNTYNELNKNLLISKKDEDNKINSGKNKSFETQNSLLPTNISYFLKYTLILNELYLSIANDFTKYSFNYNLSHSLYEFNFNPQFSNFDLYELMYFIFEILKALIILKGLKDSVQPIIELDPNLPQYFNSDEKRIKEILLILIDNSLKNTKKGYIKISAQINLDKEFKETSTFNYVKISVEDSGVGIQEKALNQILKYFENNDFLNINENTSKFKQKSEYAMNSDKEIHLQSQEKESVYMKKFDERSNPFFEYKGHGLILIKQILDKIGKGINCFSFPNDKTIFSFVLDNKLLDVSDRKYDLMNNNNPEISFYSNRKKMSPMEALNGLSYNLRLKPIEIKESGSARLNINGLGIKKSTKGILTNLHKSNNNGSKDKIFKSDRIDETKNINKIEIIKTENPISLGVKDDFNNNDYNYAYINKNYLSENDNLDLNKNSNSNRSDNIKFKIKNIGKMKELIGEKTIINEISSSDDSIDKEENEDYVAYKKQEKSTHEFDKTILDSPKDMQKKFENINEKLKIENISLIQKNIDTSHKEFINTNPSNKKNHNIKEFSKNFNLLIKIFIPLLKMIKYQEGRIVLVIEDDRNTQKILKAQIKKIYSLEASQTKIKVIFIEDGILALLMIYFETFILKQKKISSILFSKNTHSKQYSIINCFGFYEIFKNNLYKNNIYNPNIIKIGVFSEELTHVKINNDTNINNTFDNNFFNNLHILRINNNINFEENIKNGLDVDSYFNSDEEFDSKNNNKNFKLGRKIIGKYDYNELKQFLIF